MGHYRFYELDLSDHIMAGYSVECGSDAEAMRAARTLLERAAGVEVWKSTNCVAHLSAEARQLWGQLREELDGVPLAGAVVPARASAAARPRVARAALPFAHAARSGGFCRVCIAAMMRFARHGSRRNWRASCSNLMRRARS
jgi:hypothetical protein